MPLSIHPFFRNRQAALEKAGLIVKLNSLGYTVKKWTEAHPRSSGTPLGSTSTYEDIPLGVLTFYFNGTKSVAKE